MGSSISFSSSCLISSASIILVESSSSGLISTLIGSVGGMLFEAAGSGVTGLGVFSIFPPTCA
jgi:hypothetical protein